MNRKIYINRILLIISLSVLLSCGGSEETPLAKIITEQSRFLKGYPIEFSADLKAGAAASDYEFTFDFGDSTSATGIEVVHVYDSPGDYTVSLTITGSSGAEKDTRDIKVLNSLELMAIYSVRVDSPSGLTFGSNKSSLWTVSDKPGGRVYEIDTLGARIRSLNYNGNDLEGVSFDSRDSTLWMVDENLGQLIHLGSDGEEVVQRLRHLLLVDVDETVMQPVSGELIPRGCFGLGYFVLVVREDQILATTVDIECITQMSGAHRRALDVPARSPR